MEKKELIYELIVDDTRERSYIYKVRITIEIRKEDKYN